MWDALLDWDFPYSDFDSDSDSNSCDDEFGLIRLFGDHAKPYVELPPSGSPRAYSWSDDDSGCDDDHTVPVEKSDGFDVCNTYRMDISKKTRCLDYDMFSQVAVEEYNRRFKYKMVVYQDELDEVLAETSTENKTVIIAVVNKAYVEGDKSMLDLFLDGFWIGDETQGLVNHILIVVTDPVSYNRCKFLRLHCYKLETEGVDFAGEQAFMSEDYVKMMWRRTLFLGDVLKRGYNFIFTDTDILWLRNPFSVMSPNKTFDLQMACETYQGKESFKINNGFTIFRSNHKTMSLYDIWYAKGKEYIGKNEQDVFVLLMQNGLLKDLGLSVRFWDTIYFSGFCENSRDVGFVVTVHANCCYTINNKLADLTTVIHDDWKRAKKLSANETSTLNGQSTKLVTGKIDNYSNVS